MPAQSNLVPSSRVYSFLLHHKYKIDFKPTVENYIFRQINVNGFILASKLTIAHGKLYDCDILVHMMVFLDIGWCTFLSLYWCGTCQRCDHDTGCTGGPGNVM